MGDMQEKCGCRRPDITVFEMCRSCGSPVNFEVLRQQAINTYDRDGQPIEDPSLPRRHRPMQDSRRCLRVLHLNSGTAQILSGTFECAWIHHVRPYEAISYVWGGEDGDYTKSEFIVVDDKVFPITKNCAAALRKVRKPSDIRVVWIDSLCINQNDVNERSAQVGQMNKIFSGAQKVHIYLGNNVDDTTSSNAAYALSSMRNLGDFNKRLSAHEDYVQALRTLFTQTYFSRTWIIQEVLLAKSAEMHWGIATTPWQMPSKEHLGAMREHGIAYHMPDWMRTQAIGKGFWESESLGELLFSAMGSSASNDRDKVYGLYGLLFDPNEEGLVVDYSLSVRQVFTDMAGHLIRKHDALKAILRRASCDDAPPVGDERLPSWVPDFRSRLMRKDVSIFCRGSSFLNVRPSPTSEKVVSSCDKDKLCLRGHRLKIFGDRKKLIGSSTVVRCGVREQECTWEIRAVFPVDFDLERHTVFWMRNGLFLQLESHPTIQGTYKFLGECGFSHLGHFPPLVVHNNYRSFAAAMFGNLSLEPHEVKFLWKLYASFEIILPDKPSQPGLVSSIDRLIDMGRVNADRALNVEKAFNTYRCFSSDIPWDFLSWYGPENDSQKRLSATLPWILGPDSSLGPSRRRMFSRGDTLEPDIHMMFDFEIFWESQDTWKVLHRLDRVLKPPEGHGIQKINELCQSWLMDYEEAENLIRKFSGVVDADVSLTQEFLGHLDAWERTTKKLSETLQWTEERFWPFEKLPKYCIDNYCDSHQTDDKGPMVDWVIKHNFNNIRLKLGSPPPTTCRGESKIRYLLSSWGEVWYRMIRSIPQLSAIGAQFGPAELIQLKELFRLEEDCLKRDAWRETGMGIFPAETITLI